MATEFELITGLFEATVNGKTMFIGKAFSTKEVWAIAVNPNTSPDQPKYFLLHQVDIEE